VLPIGNETLAGFRTHCLIVLAVFADSPLCPSGMVAESRVNSMRQGHSASAMNLRTADCDSGGGRQRVPMRKSPALPHWFGAAAERNLMGTDEPSSN
jgi:hypothetical protein